MGRLRSIQARYTLIVTLIAAVLLGLVAVGVDLVIRHVAERNVYDESLRQARRISAKVRDGGLTDPIQITIGHVTLVEVLDDAHKIVATSPDAAGHPALSDVWPDAEDRVSEFHGCPWPGVCVMGVAVRVSDEVHSPVIYAAEIRPTVLAGPWLELALATIVGLGLAVVAGITWRLVGHTLRPVTQIREGMAEITVSDLSKRLPEIPGDDEIARLARTANATLDRLERSVRRQRGFASDASHELRTPIAGMRAQIETALMYPDDTDLLATLTAVKVDLDRLEAIITDLLLLARLGTDATGQHNRIRLDTLITQELARRPEGRVPIRADLAEVAVEGSWIQLVRLVGNLLDNAQRHANSEVLVIVRREGEEAVLEVLDDGEGIAEAHRERVFERFVRLEASRRRDATGTGLGLALVRDIAAAHHGTVTIEPSETGARFVLRIPMVT